MKSVIAVRILVFVFMLMLINITLFGQTWNIPSAGTTSTTFFGTTSTDSDLLFKAGNKSLMTLKASSELLEIGSSAAGSKLEIFGSNYPGIKLYSTGTYTGTLYMGIATCTACWSNLAVPGDVVISTHGTSSGNFIISSRANDDIIFSTGDYSTESEKLRILLDGKVTIGSIASSTDYKLFVENGITSAKVQTGKIISPDNADINFIPTVSGSATTPVMKVLNGGQVVIGNVTTAGTYKLYVETGILTEKVKIAMYSTSPGTHWSDFVFEDSYKLPKLESVEKYILQNNHLPDMPSEKQLIESGGVDVFEMLKLQQQKIEELFLYTIELNKKIQMLESQ